MNTFRKKKSGKNMNNGKFKKRKRSKDKEVTSVNY